MPTTIAPNAEALQVIADRINSDDTFDIGVKATPCDLIIDPLEDISGIRVDVCSESESVPTEFIGSEDYSTHQIRVWIRSKVDQINGDQVDALKLLTTLIMQRVDNYDSSDLRVRVWDAGFDPGEVPVKSLLRESLLFVASILLRVEVAP